MDDRLHHVKGIAAAFFYGFCSVLMAFLNKILMDTYRFHFPMCIMVAQMSLTVLLLLVLSSTRLVSIPPYTLKAGRLFLMPAVFYAANSVLGLFSLSHMNVAMYGVLKRCVPLATLTLSVLVMRKSCPSPLTLLSVLLLTVGCIVAGSGDLKFHLGGYVCGGLSNLTQALYLLLVQQHAADHSSSTLHTLLLNSVNGLPLLMVALVVSGEAQQVVAAAGGGGAAGEAGAGGPTSFLFRLLGGLGFDDTHDDHDHHHQLQHQHHDHGGGPPFLVAFLAVLLCGIALNYSLFLCTNHTSALTTSVVGGAKALVQTAIGVFTFGGVSPNLATKLGIALSLCGTLLYVSTKYTERSRMDRLGHMKKVASLASAQDFRQFASASSSSSSPSSNRDRSSSAAAIATATVATSDDDGVVDSDESIATIMMASTTTTTTTTNISGLR